MQFSLAEFERTQGNSSVSESRSRNTRRHVRRQREEREEREKNRRTLTPHLQLNDSVAVATLARMLCKQPQIVSQDRTPTHARKSSALRNFSSKTTGFPT